MSAMIRLASRLMARAALVATATACTSAPPASPELMARCTQLYMLWARYEQHITFHHTGQRARAELALEDCRYGRYETGLQELEKLLRRGRIPIPPVTSFLATRAISPLTTFPEVVDFQCK